MMENLHVVVKAFLDRDICAGLEEFMPIEISFLPSRSRPMRLMCIVEKSRF